MPPKAAPIPAPRLTLWAAALVALGLSALWLTGLGILVFLVGS